MTKATSSSEQTQEESTSVIFRSITPADRATLDDIKTVQDIRTDSKAVVFILRDYRAMREHFNVARRQAYELQVLLLSTAKAVQAHNIASDQLRETQNALLSHLAGS